MYFVLCPILCLVLFYCRPILSITANTTRTLKCTKYIGCCCLNFYRGEEIRKETVSVKDESGKWEKVGVAANQLRQSDHESECESETLSTSENASVATGSITTELVVTGPAASSSTETVSGSYSAMSVVTECVASKTAGDTVSSASSSILSRDIPKFEPNDPAAYCGRRLKMQDISTLLSVGPCQPTRDYRFPGSDVNGRAFNPDWFTCNMADKTTYKRKWLTYSVSADKAYCIPCMAFSGPRGSEVWTTSGYSDWRNGSRDVKNHELSGEHRTSEMSMIQWKAKGTIDQMTDKNRSEMVEDNRKVMECIIDCVRFLSSEMLAFWGDTSDDGKFIAVFRLIAKRDPNAAAYLQKIDQARMDGKKMGVNLISPGHITSMLRVMKDMVVEKIVRNIQSQRKACIIFDSTQDYSKREASVLLMRYLEVDADGEQTVKERLLHVFTTGETSGSVLTEHVLKDLEKMRFDVDWIVGQCYDGAGNMRGKYSGMATFMQTKQSKAVYIWCHAHRLNLVVNSVAACSHDVKNTLGLLEELYVFMNGHKRNDVFIRQQREAKEQALQLKRVSTTRWNSSEAAVNTVLSRYSEVLQTLSCLRESTYDSATVTQATGLYSRLRDIRVIVCMLILKRVYHIIGPASRSLQGIAIDLAGAASLLTDCKNQFEKLRADVDKEWAVIFKESVEFACAHGVSSDFPSERRKKKKKMDDEVVADECLSGEQRMKVDTFITAIDEVIQQLNSRFSEQNVVFMKQLSFFTPAGLLDTRNDDISIQDIQQICQQYDLDPIEVHSELVDFRSSYRVCSSNATNQVGA